MLHIALQDGFEHERVVVKVDGNEVYRKDDVHTDQRINIADAVDVPVAEDEVTVVVELPGRHTSSSMVVSTSETAYVGVSIANGRLALKTSETPFRYA